MKKTFSFTGVLLAALVLAGCATTLTRDIEIETQSAPGFSLSDYKSYGWVAAAQIVNDPQGQWEPPQFDADAEIRFLINSQLRGKGLSEAGLSGDLLVAYLAGVDMTALELKKDPASEIELLENAPKGALMVLLIERNSGRAVWAGVAVGDVKERRSPEDGRKRLAYAVERMFREIPVPR